MVLCNYFKSFDGYEVTYSTANEVKKYYILITGYL